MEQGPIKQAQARFPTAAALHAVQEHFSQGRGWLFHRTAAFVQLAPSSLWLDRHTVCCAIQERILQDWVWRRNTIARYVHLVPI